MTVSCVRRPAVTLQQIAMGGAGVDGAPEDLDASNTPDSEASSATDNAIKQMSVFNHPMLWDQSMSDVRPRIWRLRPLPVIVALISRIQRRMIRYFDDFSGLLHTMRSKILETDLSTALCEEKHANSRSMIYTPANLLSSLARFCSEAALWPWCCSGIFDTRADYCEA